MRIAILALDGVFDTGLAALQDTFATANDLDDDGGSALKSQVVAVRQYVKTAHGLSVPASRAVPSDAPDIVLVPAIGAKTTKDLPPALAHRDVAAAGALLRAWSSQGSLVAAACTGTFVVAESGLLDGRSATTSWWLAPCFRTRYPNVRLDDSRMLVRDGEVVTAGAVLAHFDLALWVVRRVSPTLAATTARYLMIDARSSQAAYAIPDHLSHTDPIVERFESWARSNLCHGFSLDASAKATGTSRRTLARRLKVVLGKSPLAYFQDLRVHHAVHLLQTTGDSIDQIATQVGYADGVTLRTLLRRHTGRSSSQLRVLSN